MEGLTMGEQQMLHSTPPGNRRGGSISGVSGVMEREGREPTDCGSPISGVMERYEQGLPSVRTVSGVVPGVVPCSARSAAGLPG